ncbi:MAG TPA: FAD-dependent oxidoreductase [Gaiellaceae bacterium]|nr:FAD-dependent oxidoreductase [Gaiellaceae bacterium]
MRALLPGRRGRVARRRSRLRQRLLPLSPLRAAVVGSGPAGFYAAGALLSADVPVEVDMFERLPTPWGLVRLGVAPDHPKLKTVSRAFERIAEKPGFRFLGNVEIGRDIGQADLARLYDAVVYAVGAQTDRRLGIPGEDLPGSWAATEFVAWYNGHPDYQELAFDLAVDRAVVIGVGNVALDVARMLALTPEELAPTDTADAAIAAICGASIREIVVVGRRGPAQAAFTTPELAELGELTGADVIVDSVDLEGAVATDTNSERNLDVLREFAARTPSGKPKRVVLKFFRAPIEIRGTDRVEGVELVRTVLDQDGRAVATDERETLECGLVFRSVGYRGVELPGVPFDEKGGVIPNEDGRVAPGVYVAGWIKRGPTGVIGTNKKDATETVEHLLADLRDAPRKGTAAADVDALLDERGVRRVVYDGWLAIDGHERGRGEPLGRPRVKLCTWNELLASAFAVDLERGSPPEQTRAR